MIISNAFLDSQQTQLLKMSTPYGLIRLHRPCHIYLQRRGTRCISTQPKNANTSPPTSTPHSEQQTEKSWLTRRVESSPVTRKVFFAVTDLLGYGSPKQLAGRQAFTIYEQVAATIPDQDKEFWQQGASQRTT